jgi:hypothetical protein
MNHVDLPTGIFQTRAAARSGVVVIGRRGAAIPDFFFAA